MAADQLRYHPSFPKEVEVKVMEGGYSGWLRKFGKDKDMARKLFENLEGRGEWVEGEEEDHSVELREKAEKEL